MRFITIIGSKTDTMIKKIRFQNYKPFSGQEELELRHVTLIIGKYGVNQVGLEHLVLTKEMVNCLLRKQYTRFAALRKKAFADMVAERLGKLGIKVANESTQAEILDVDMLMDEFDDFSYEEKAEFCRALLSLDYSSSIFPILSIGENRYEMHSDLLMKKYIFSEENAKSFLDNISTKYCNGEDPDLYFDWLATLNK